MSLSNQSKIWMTGLAMFSMFFGAGNVIFPLAIGHYTSDQTSFAIIGLLLTAVVMPFAGMMAMFLYDGDYKLFFSRMGKIPGFMAALLIMVLLGPLGSTPRCIALSYSTLKMMIPDLSVILFSSISCVLIFLFSFRKNRIISLLGYVLTPVLLVALGAIIIKGLIQSPDPAPSDFTELSAFWHGLKEGYNTMDLLAAFFFSSVILGSLKKKVAQKSENTQRQLLGFAFKASLIGGILLAVTYIGFSYIASFHGQSLVIQGNDQLLAAITLKIIGPSAGLLVCLTVALACLTTAIALSSVFAEFLQKAVFKGKIRYEISLMISLVVTFFVSIIEFNGISSFLGPVLEVCYPALILLTTINLIAGLRKLKKAKEESAIGVTEPQMNLCIDPE